jgi:hypothetical protein
LCSFFFNFYKYKYFKLVWPNLSVSLIIPRLIWFIMVHNSFFFCVKCCALSFNRFNYHSLNTHKSNNINHFKWHLISKPRYDLFAKRAKIQAQNTLDKIHTTMCINKTCIKTLKICKNKVMCFGISNHQKWLENIQLEIISKHKKIQNLVHI